jgi:hypothetical protein
MESQAMDHEQSSRQRPAYRDQSTPNGAPTSGSSRQLARNKGLAWVSALTVGAGAAGVLGAAAIAITLPRPQSASAATTTVAERTPARTPAASQPGEGQNNGDGDDDSSGASSPQQAAPAAPLQAAPPPAPSNNPPAATSGGS